MLNEKQTKELLMSILENKKTLHEEFNKKVHSSTTEELYKIQTEIDIEQAKIDLLDIILETKK